MGQFDILCIEDKVKFKQLNLEATEAPQQMKYILI